MTDDGEEVDLHEGMQVSNEDGEELGTLSALLLEEDEEDAEFFLLKTGEGADERLIPFEAVLGVGDGALVIDVTSDVLDRYPAVKPGAEPSEEDIDRAYDVYDETAQYVGDE